MPELLIVTISSEAISESNSQEPHINQDEYDNNCNGHPFYPITAVNILHVSMDWVSVFRGIR